MITRLQIMAAVEALVQEAVLLTLSGEPVDLRAKYERFAEDLLSAVTVPTRPAPPALMIAQRMNTEYAQSRHCPICAALPGTKCVRTAAYPKARNGKEMHATHRNRTGPYLVETPPRPSEWMVELTGPERDRLLAWVADNHEIFVR